MPFRILFVEDNSHKRNRVLEYINSLGLGLEISLAASFSSGSQEIERSTFDLVLLDLSLPTYDKSELESGGRFRTFGGREIARKLLRKNKNSKVIYITQYESFSDKGKSYTLKNLELELAEESKSNYCGMIHFDSAKSSWKDALNKALRDALV